MGERSRSATRAYAADVCVHTGQVTQFQAGPEPDASAEQFEEGVVIGQGEHPPGRFDSLVYIGRSGPRIAECGEGGNLRFGVADPPSHGGRLFGKAGALVG